MSLIELEHVSRHYTPGGVTVRALDDVSLRIDAGDMVAIMGASGSGKSTLMNLLGCLDKPSGGRLLVDGQDVAGLSSDQAAALRRDTVGFIFQRYHLLSHLDAVGNVELPGVYAGYSRRQRRARAIALLQRLGLGERLAHKPDALSGGQQQRVSIARALMNGGRIILADEPTGALDSASGAELLALLGELNAMGHTVILVTHDAEVAAHARRIIELRDGRVVRDAPSPGAPCPPMPGAQPPLLPVARRPAHWLAPWREAFAMSLAALNGNRMRSALSMLGISIGIAAVVSIVSLGQSMDASMEKMMKNASANNLSISQGNRKLARGVVAKPFTMRDVAALRSLPGVTAVVPRYSFSTTARHGRNDDRVTVSGIAANGIASAFQSVTKGREFGELDLEARAQVAILDPVAHASLFAPGEPVLGQQVMIGALPFTVIGLSTNSNSTALPDGLAQGNLYIPHTTYTSKLDTRNEINSLSLQFTTQLPLESFHGYVRQRLLALHGGIEDFSLNDYGIGANAYGSVGRTLSTILSGIAAIALLVGGVGVMNIMLVSVAERTREIGIRMAVGARRRDVQRQFLIESVLLCCMGGLAGLVLPWLAAQAVMYAYPFMPIAISGGTIALAVGTCAAIGLLFGNMPARRAAALRPVVALARN